MRSISIISKLTGVTNNVEASEITLSSPSIVELKAERSDIASIVRTNNDMIITLHDGEVITVKNFYAFADQGGNQLVLEDNHGALWWVQDTDSAFHFEHINNIDELMAATGAENHGGAAIWPWVLGGVAVAGGIALAAGGGGGGGGGGDNDKGNSNGGPGNPNPPPPANDVTPPAAPTNLNVSADGKTITGKAEPGSTVTITDPSGQIIGKGTAGSDGTFTIPLKNPQISGEDLTAHATDPSGNTGPDATVIAPNIPLPDAPTLTNVVDDVAPVLGTVPKTQSTNDNTPTLQGTGKAGTTVHIYDGGKEIGTAVVDASGNWSYTPTTALSDGSHSFSVTATNAKGESTHSPSYTITIDTVAPEAPAVDQLQDDVGSIKGSIVSGTYTDETAPIIHGTGEAGDKVTIFDNGIQIAQITVGSDGKWSFTPTQPLADGNHTITLIQTDPAGNVSKTTTSPTFIVDHTPPSAPTDLRVSDDGLHVTGKAEPGSTVTITDANGEVLGSPIADDNGNFTITLSTPKISGEELTAHATDTAGNTGPDSTVVAPNIPLPDAPTLTSVVDDVAPVTGTVPNNAPLAPTNDNTPTLQGTGQAGTTIHIYDNGQEIDTTVVAANGSWSFTPTTALADGSHSFSATTINAKGESEPSGSYTITIDTVAPEAPELAQLQDNTGKITGVITNGMPTDENQPGIHGKGEPGDKVTIFDNGVQIAQVTVDGSGNWTFTPSQPLADGTHTITLIQTDAAGNISSATTSPTFTVDHTPPAAAAIDNVSLDGTTVTGTAEAGAIVTVTDGNNVQLGTATADNNGNFTLTLDPAKTHNEALVAHIEDQAGNVGPDTSFNASNSQVPTVPVLDSVEDDAGVTTGPLSNGQSTDDNTPTISGTAEAGSTVNIFSNGVLLGTSLVDGTGHWTFTPTQPLTDGPQALTFNATNLFGTSGTSPGFTVDVDTTPPSPPMDLLVSDDGLHVTGSAEPGSTITVTDGNGNILGTGVTGDDGLFDVTPLTSAQLNAQALMVTATDSADNVSDNATVFAEDHTPPAAPTDVTINDEGSVVSGKAEPGSTVNVTDDHGHPLGSAQTGSDGNFTVPISPSQTNGETLEVSATDPAGNTGPETPVDAPDTTAPVAPLISAVVDDVPLYVGNLTNGQTTNDERPEFKGKAEAGATVKIYDNGALLDSVVADSNGNWSYTSTPLAQGLHNLTVTATDADGNTSPASSFTLTVDSIAPQAPEITLISDDASPITGSVPNNGFTNDSTPTLSGTGEPGTEVTITDGGAIQETVTVNASGTWTFTPSPALDDKEYHFTVTSTDAAGNTTAPSAEFVITVVTTTPDTPTIDSAVDDVGSITLPLLNNASTDDTLPELSGTGPAGTTITLYDGNTPIGTFAVGDDGLWSITPDHPLTEGQHNLHAVATDAAGNASLLADFNLTVDTTPPDAPLILAAEGVVGGAAATINTGGSTQDGTPTLTGSGEEGATINIYDNGGTTPIGTVIVPAGGTWSFDLALSEGPHSLTAVATDPVGNVGLPSAAFTLIVDSLAPLAPTTFTVIDDQAPGLGVIANNGSTNDTTPTFTGTGATAGDTIALYNGVLKLGETTVRADGSWSVDPTTPLTAGTYTLTVKEIDAAGNASPASTDFTFTVDLTPSAAPVISLAVDDVGGRTGDVLNNQITDDNKPVFQGTGEVGDTITLYSGTTVIGTAVVVAGGTWSLTPTGTLPEGLQSFTATATDAAGNISNPSANFTLTVDSTPLTAPVVTDIVDDVSPITTSLTSGSYTNDTTPTFNGTGKVGSTVTIYDTDGTTALGSTTVGAGGTWTIAPTLTEGNHDLVIKATDPTGNSVTAAAPITLHVDTLPPPAPIVTSPTDQTGTLVSGTAEPGSTVIIKNSGGTVLGTAVADPGTGAFTVTLSPAQTTGLQLTAIAQDLAGNQSTGTPFSAVTSNALQPPTIEVLDDVTPNTGNLTSGQSTNDNLPTLRGLAGSNADVTVYIDGIEQPPVTADASGVWTYQFTTPLSEGQHTFAVLQDNGSLFSGKSPNFVITVDTVQPTQPTITTVTDDVAPITGTVNSGQATNDPRPAITGTGEIGSTITILDNGTSIGTAVVGTGGTWTFTPTSDLSPGLHPITVTSTDAAGNVSAPSAGFSVNVDTLTTAPVISSVTDNVGTPAPVISGVPTNDNTPTFTGTAEANSTITISENGNVIGTALVDGTGNWNFTPNPALTDGSHNLTIITTDTAGNVSPATTFNAVIDTTAPIVPAITLVVDDQTQVGNVTLTSGQSTKDTLPTLSGTSEANAVITLKDGNTIIGTTTANGNGEWSLDPTTALGQGSHNLTVTATDAAGNVSNPSGIFSVVVDSVAPTAPLIVTVTDNTAPNIGPITSGQPTNETRPAITGSGEVGSTIKIYDGSNPTPLGSATVGSGGTWSFTPPTALSSGSHNLTVTATDAAGNVSAPSAIFNVVVDLAAPGTPVITNIADDVGTEKGDLTSGQSTDDTLPLISGTAENGASVKIYDNGTLIGTVNASATDGTWNFTPPVGSPLTNGNHAFTVTATDSAGNVSSPSNTFNIIVDTAAPTAPIVIQAFDDVGPVTGALVNGQSTNDNQPLLSGTAEANSIVSISDNGVFLDTVTASATGTWSYTPPVRNDGQHIFTATSTDAAGNVGAVSGSFTLTIDTSTPVTPALPTVYDDVAGGVFNANLTNGQVTNDARPTISGTGEVGTTITILDGGTPIGTVTVPAGGSWTFTPTTPLPTGLHTITLTATDAAGNVSGPTAGFAITVDTTAPTTPVISSIVDDVAGGVANNALGSGQVTNDNRPTLNGTAEAGSTVNIYDNGALYTTVIADGSGNWTYTSPTAVLAEGSHTFTVTATDVAGNISTTSLPSVIVVDITPPTAPTGMTVNGTGTIVTGNAEAGSLVTITGSGGVVLGTATADGTGKFSASISPAQTNSQALFATAQDVAGNTGASAGFSAPNTALPGVPVITSILDDAAPVTGGVANGQSTNDATPTINGTADVGATVSIYNNGQLMGTVVATNGTWSYTPGTLTDGSHAFTATATNVNGTGSPSTAITVTVDTIAPPTPTATISADGTTISGTAEANSTVNITLPGGTVITTTANGSGAYSLTLPTREIGGEQLSVTASDAAGNTSPSVTAIAPTLPLAANDNVIDLALSSTATVSPPVHYNDYGVLLVGALGNSVQVLGNDTAQVQFNVGPGTGNITIEAAATGIVLTLLNSLEVAVQRFDSGTGTWSTVYDSSQAQFANLLTIGASGITFKIDNLPEGTYRVLSYNTNLLATGSLTSLDVAVEQVGPGVVTGETSHQGNVITDIDPSGGQDTAPAGTVVTSVTNAQGQELVVGAGGADINGLYGTLHINQNGSYTYTLNNTTAAVLGHTENFSYTITQNGISDTAQLVVTLGNGAPASSVTATDNTAALAYNTDVEAVNHGASQQSGFSVVSVGLGNVLNANVLANMANPIIFDVEEGSTRTMTLQASVGGVALLSTFDLYVYKFNETIQQYEQYKVVNTWLTAPLLGGTSGQLTLTLPGGEYLFLLNNATGVTALTGYTLNILQDHTYAVESVTATTNGNVLTDDVFTAGNTGHITQVNGVAVAASGTTTIVGEYGTLTIDANGNYTYKLNSGLGADSIKTPDSFVYTVTSSNGDTDSASLNITATPHTVDAFNDISGVMAVNTAQTTAAYSDTTVGNATWTTSLVFATHGDGSGTFVVGNNDVLHNPILHFDIDSLLPLGGVSINWTLTDGAGITRTGTISGPAILGGSPTVDLSGMDLHSGTWTLSYTGNAGILAVGGITITPSVTGTTIDLDSYSTLAGSSVNGNIYDGSNSSGAIDQLGTVHTLLSITGFNGTTTTLNPLTDSSSTATIQGHYGTLVMGLDGAYTYTLNAGVSPASMTTKETFTYTLNDQNGHSDTATLTINMNPQFVSTAQGDVINGSAYGDTLVYHLLNSANATGGNGADTWKDFHMADGDKINIHDLLTGWNPATSNIANYLSVSYNGTSTVISIDRDGTAATHSPTTLVTLENTHVTLDELVQQNHIIT
ncbi:BapA/Bap/LapF family large adhesin [Buttiauxella gaviniae]|uniref:BapA/Bap/LapF family large adhesin n=1 Tax=Buttiauxella gaviniae TaxID=82990 RepID=UPI0039B1080A